MTWNRKSVSVICRVTWFIIHPSICNEFDIVCIKFWAFFLQILHAISKVQLCCYIFSTKTFSKLVPSFGEVVWPFDNFFVRFLCLLLFNISSICLWDVSIPWNVKRGIFLRLLFIAVYWYLTNCFAMFLIVEVFTLIIVMSKAIACIWKFFRSVVFSCLYRYWSIFYPELIWV